MSKIKQMVDSMDPEAAASEIALIMKKLFPLLSEETRLKFVESLAGDSGGDKVTSMVHLWLAECMDEGIDPTHLSRGLMNKVTQSAQLQSVADPEVRVLFEDWLEELEAEVAALVQKTGTLEPRVLGEKLGVSEAGASFLITKLKREGKL